MIFATSSVALRAWLPRTMAQYLGSHMLLNNSNRRTQMKPSTEDQLKGTVHEATGTVKEKAGKIMHNPDLAAEGQDEKLAGKVQQKVGQIKKVFEK
jgi:uncharacterized protein YjbJ (UPF0337 family)